jgi:DNA polymerase V
MFLLGSRSSAGFPSPADDYLEKSLDLNDLLIKNKVATFFMQVEGDGLQTSGIKNNDLLIVDRSAAAGPGKVVVAILDGELVLRKIEKVDSNLVLIADDLPPLNLSQETQIWGVVTATVHQF